MSTQTPQTVDLSEFDTVYRLEHEARFTAARTRLEVDALVRVLGLQPTERILDLACGWGRHLRELKRRGFGALVGVDVQGAFLEPIEGVTLFEQDATRLEFEDAFDAVYCVANGLFADPNAAARVLRGVARALKPQGRFLLDTSNRERLVQAGTTRSWRKAAPPRAELAPLLGGGELPWILEEAHFDLRTGAQHLEQQRIFADGRCQTRRLTRFHYTLSELSERAHAAGFDVHEVYGDWTLAPYTPVSPRMIVLLTKGQRH
ncbi:class I SAM-dependent methyltransferase [Truepera radiovictrix]|uniref:Methyltransferase type 11 n=1 Tax=Truepera radiovictrix (strain DSM 17093 / CIP 108686 / LMG 22925 / RQ-24) TaxID=649638 RepID=D7CUX4_TRURR|nr:methyltransferase domain-containing protein [Truepera radiovictrix]ADI15801.1 Methyltransferase type 11 [Truepera radiovictrix DSM 17093]WMT58571.1 methyltransferase domain-containing protein [Truepera radiovictrix]